LEAFAFVAVLRLAEVVLQKPQFEVVSAEFTRYVVVHRTLAATGNCVEYPFYDDALRHLTVVEPGVILLVNAPD
jgi:hypothetical protein